MSLPSLFALGIALADGNGENTFKRASSFLNLGYRTLVFRDNDKRLKQTKLMPLLRHWFV